MALVKTTRLAHRAKAKPASAPVLDAPKPRPVKRRSDRRETAAERLAAATTELAGGLTEAGAAAEELQRSLAEIASGAEEAAGAAQESLAAISAMDEQFERARARAESARRHTDALQTLAAESRVAVEVSIQAIQANSRRQADGVDLIEALERRAGEIATIIDGVAAVADQTSLLALNAAIEAARAGDSGRTFTILADDIRALAQRAEKQSAEVRALAEAIAAGVREAAERTRRATDVAQQEAAKAQVAGDALEMVRAGMSQVAENSQEILLAAVEAVIAIGESRRGGESVASAAEEQAAAAAQAQRAVQQQVQSLEQSQTAAASLMDMTDRLGGGGASTLEIAAAAEELSATVQELSGAAAEILIAVEQISRGAQIQAAATQQSGAAMAQVEKAARLAGERGRANAKDVVVLRAQLAESRALVDGLAAGVAAVVEENVAVVRAIDILEEQASAIGRFVDGLGLIALQTTMLATSSAVEAARAGEGGDGFAQVSTDIRKLAGEAADNADQVKELTLSVGRQVVRVRRELDQLSALAQAELERTGAIVLRLGRIADDSADLETGAEDIADGAAEILAASSQVLVGVGQIAAAAEEAGRAATEAASAARQQSDGAESLAAAIEEIALLAGDLQAAPRS